MLYFVFRISYYSHTSMSIAFICPMKYRHELPPDVLSWQELYEIFVKAGQAHAVEVTYSYEVKARQKGVIMEMYRYQMAYVEEKLSEEVTTGKLMLCLEEWDLIYNVILSYPKPLPFDLVEKVRKLRAIASRC
ncbi:hypothetical protein GCM10028806_27700 [Spirosoma terrae]